MASTTKGPAWLLQLTRLRKDNTYFELAVMLECSPSTVQRMLRSDDYEPRKGLKRRIEAAYNRSKGK
jgi:hypothetical protein